MRKYRTSQPAVEVQSVQVESQYERIKRKYLNQQEHQYAEEEPANLSSA